MNIIPLRALKDNYIWAMVNDETKEVVIVDPGQAQPVIDFLNNNKLKLKGIFITHHHGDHTHGLEDIIKHSGNIPVYGSEQSPNRFINHRIKDGDNITCAHFDCRAIAIPGHTLDHTAYYSVIDQVVFTGDTLFSAGCGRIFEGTPSMMYESLTKLMALPAEVEMYCGHEYTASNLNFAKLVEPGNAAITAKLSKLEECTLPSTLGEEKTFNPFLRCEVPEVIEAVSKYAGKKLQNTLEVFANLREWKNNI